MGDPLTYVGIIDDMPLEMCERMGFLKLDQKPPDMLPSELIGCFGTTIFQVLYFSIKLPVSLVSLRAFYISEQIVQNKKLNLYYEAMLTDSQKLCLQICQTRKIRKDDNG